MERMRKVVRTDEDMIKLLREQDDLIFNSISFELAIDLNTLLTNNPIEGVVSVNNQSVIFNGLEFSISDLKFSKPLSFVNCSFKMPLVIKNTVFEEGVKFNFSKFEECFQVTDVIAEGVSTFGFSSLKSVVIMRSIFATVDSEHSRIKIDGSFRIINTTINSRLDFKKCVVKKQLHISGNLKYALDLSEGEIGSLHLGSQMCNSEYTEINDLILSETKIAGQVQFNNILIKGDVVALRISFEELIDLVNVTFTGVVFFRECSFMRSIQSESVIVKKSLNFYGSHFNAIIHFTSMDLREADIVLTGTHINSDLWLGTLKYENPVTYEGTINLEGAMISSSSIVRIYNLNTKQKPLGVIKLSNSVIRGLLDVSNVYVKTFNLDGTVVTGNIQDNNTLSQSIPDRSSARLLKHEAKKINNMISASSYYKLEMQLYYDSISYRNQFADCLILWLSRVSNSYGTNWWRAVLFTLYTGIGFYVVFTFLKGDLVFYWEENSRFFLMDTKFLSGFINYFWLPTGFNELTKCGELAGGKLGAMFFILGKILIAFGIYQTIAAFRKFL